MKVVFCASEVFPFVKTGGLADVCGALPIALEKSGVEVCIILPHYGMIDAKKFKIKNVRDGLGKTTLGKNIQVYFVEHHEYFGREGVYGDSRGGYADNLQRYQFLCDQTFRILKEVDFKPDIMHCHDWQTALVPVYLKEWYKDDSFFKKTKSILTIHNLAFQGEFPGNLFYHLGLRQDLYSEEVFEFYRKINLLKAGIIFSDEVTTVSPQYAKEIQTAEYGCNLQGVLHRHRDGVQGILNGIDYKVWHPESDELIVKKYSAKNHADVRIENKRALQDRLHFYRRDDVPLFGFVSRIASQKGIDLILKCTDMMAQLDLQVVIQGVGEDRYYGPLKAIEARYPDKFRVCIEFNEELAHQIYASADFFLMPSRYEPCGLSQLIGFRYGVIPVAYKTGGLADTITPYHDPKGNGFVFEDFHPNGFMWGVGTAVAVYHQPGEMKRLVDNAFNADFSWDRSAEKYLENYTWLLSGSQEV